MTQILTVEELLAATETTVILPGLSESLGQERSIRVRKIGRVEYLSFLPPLPPGAEAWLPEAFAERERAWLETLTPEQLEARRAALRDVVYHVVIAASLDPALILEQAKRLGDDAALVAAEILRFSGLLPSPGPSGGPAEAATSAPPDAA